MKNRLFNKFYLFSVVVGALFASVSAVAFEQSLEDYLKDSPVHLSLHRLTRGRSTGTEFRFVVEVCRFKYCETKKTEVFDLDADQMSRNLQGIRPIQFLPEDFSGVGVNFDRNLGLSDYTIKLSLYEHSSWFPDREIASEEINAAAILPALSASDISRSRQLTNSSTGVSLDYFLILGRHREGLVYKHSDRDLRNLMARNKISLSGLNLRTGGGEDSNIDYQIRAEICGKSGACVARSSKLIRSEKNGRIDLTQHHVGIFFEGDDFSQDDFNKKPGEYVLNVEVYQYRKWAARELLASSEFDLGSVLDKVQQASGIASIRVTSSRSSLTLDLAAEVTAIKIKRVEPTTPADQPSPSRPKPKPTQPRPAQTDNPTPILPPAQLPPVAETRIEGGTSAEQIRVKRAVRRALQVIRRAQVVEAPLGGAPLLLATENRLGFKGALELLEDLPTKLPIILPPSETEDWASCSNTSTNAKGASGVNEGSRVTAFANLFQTRKGKEVRSWAKNIMICHFLLDHFDDNSLTQTLIHEFTHAALAFAQEYGAATNECVASYMEYGAFYAVDLRAWPNGYQCSADIMNLAQRVERN